MNIDATSTKYIKEHPEDAVRVLEKLSLEELCLFLESMPNDVAAVTLPFMVQSVSVSVLESMSPAKAAAILELLEFDLILLLLRKAAYTPRENILNALSPTLSLSIQKSLQFKEGTVGGLMNTRILTLPQGITVLEAKKLAQKANPEALLHYCYVVDKAQHLKGVVDVKTLFIADRKLLIDALVTWHPISLSVHDSLQNVLSHPAWSEFDILPVVGKAGQFLGALNFRVVRRQFESFVKQEIEDEGMLDTLVSLGEVFWSVGARFLANAAANKNQMDDD